MIDGEPTHRPKHALRNVGGSRDLEKMSTAAECHVAPFGWSLSDREKTEAGRGCQLAMGVRCQVSGVRDKCQRLLDLASKAAATNVETLKPDT